MKKTVFLLSLFLASTPIFGQPAPTPVSAGDDKAFEAEKHRLELEHLRLENEKLELEMKQLKSVTVTATPTPKPKEDEKKNKEDLFQADYSKKAEETAKQNKDKDNLLTLDLVNAEVWYKDVRYSIHDFYTLAEDRSWKMTRRVEERDPHGYPRWLYRYQNLSFLKYENKDRGILTLDAPKNDGDFQFATPEGIGFDSTGGDARNAFQNLYFTYDGQKDQGALKHLRYKHSRGLAFDDRLELTVDREGKIVQLRYGVLDER